MTDGGVRSLERGLALLLAMNADPFASVTTLARRCALSRSTAYRLLGTLAGAGYVRVDPVDGGYRLAHKVRRLSEGFTDEAWLERVWPAVIALGEALFWPLSLFTFHANTMTVRRSTHERSALSIDYGMTGRAMSVAETAAGRAYLAFCPETERTWLLTQPSIQSAAAGSVGACVLAAGLADARRDGFATRVGGVMPKTASLSVPIMAQDRVLCCLSVIWIRSAMPIERAVNELAGPMRAAACRITVLASETDRLIS